LAQAIWAQGTHLVSSVAFVSQSAWDTRGNLLAMSKIRDTRYDGTFFRSSSALYARSDCTTGALACASLNRLSRAWTQPHVARYSSQRRPSVIVAGATSYTFPVGADIPVAGSARWTPLEIRPVAVGSLSNTTQVSEDVEGLDVFLKSKGLQAFLPQARSWCRKMGAAYLEEVIDHKDDLVNALGLSVDEQARLCDSVPLGIAAEAAPTPDHRGFLCSSLDALPVRRSTTAGEAQVSSHVPPSEFPGHRTLTSPAFDEACYSTATYSPLGVAAAPDAGVVRLEMPDTPGRIRRTSTLGTGQGCRQMHDSLASVPDTGLMRTRTDPKTSVELNAAAQRAQRAYVPLRAWQAQPTAVSPKVHAGVRCGPAPIRNRRSFNGGWTLVPSVSPHHAYYYHNAATGEWQYHKPEGVSILQPRIRENPSKSLSPQKQGGDAAGEDLTVNEAVVEETEALPGRTDRMIFNQQHYYRKWQSTRGSFVDPKLLRQRMPTEVDLVDPFAEEILLDKTLKAEQLQTKNFEEVRNDFLRQHGAEVKLNLDKCFAGPLKLEPAPVSQAVQQRFLRGFLASAGADLTPALHGSHADNYSSICERGLIIAGKKGDIPIAHGAAHGRGIYTACVTAPTLSRGFCSEPKMLVCAVVDDAQHVGRRENCGNFTVSAKSATVKHVGDAMVISDESRVVPLFQASASEFKNHSQPSSATTPNTLSGWLGGRRLLPGPAPPPTWTPPTFLYRKSKALHVPSGQKAFLPEQPSFAKYCGEDYGLERKRLVHKRQKGQEREIQRAEKIALRDL